MFAATRLVGKVVVMTTLMIVDGFGRGETRTAAVVRRLREELGRHQTNVTQVAARLGETQQKYSRRMRGLTPWDVESLDRFCRAFGGNFDYIVTGVKTVPTPPDDGGGTTLLLPRMDSNHQPPDTSRIMRVSVSAVPVDTDFRETA